MCQITDSRSHLSRQQSKIIATAQGTGTTTECIPSNIGPPSRYLSCLATRGSRSLVILSGTLSWLTNQLGLLVQGVLLTGIMSSDGFRSSYPCIPTPRIMLILSLAFHGLLKSVQKHGAKKTFQMILTIGQPKVGDLVINELKNFANHLLNFWFLGRYRLS